MLTDMKNLLLLSLFTALFAVPDLQAEDPWLTYYEIHDQNRTPSLPETLSFSQKLAAASPMLHYEVFGKSHQGRDLGLLIFDKDGDFSPEKIHQKGNTIVLIQAAIHPGEPVGKDAGLLLLRDIAIHGKFLDMLDHITILFIPVMNPDGHERFGPYNRINQDGPEEMGWRTNARNLNLNRDFLKADSREMQHFLRLWHHWDPHFFIDTHSTNGGDYQYAMTYAMDIFGHNDKGLVSWMRDQYIPTITEAMQNDNYPIFPYVSYRSWHDPRSGLRSGVWHPMFSNSYAAELNRPGLLLETHMLKPYPIRVESTYLMIRHTLEYLHKDDQLQKIIENADKLTASEQFRKEKFPLRYEITSDSVMVEFLGVEYTKQKSSLTGGDWFIYNPDNPETYTIPWFNKNRVTYSVELPEAYIVPVEYFDVIERLTMHDIVMKEIENEISLEIESYNFFDVTLSSRSSEGRQTASFKTEDITETRVFAPGSVIIPMDQPQARIIAHALEPMAPGSFAYWGFFNSTFERTEYFESYVMEALAREMLANEPSLKQELETAIQNDPAMKDNPYAILNWFYERTPYYDQRHNIYPVGKISDPGVVKNLLN